MQRSGRTTTPLKAPSRTFGCTIVPKNDEKVREKVLKFKLDSFIPLGNKRTFSAGMQFPPVMPLREDVKEYSTSCPSSKWFVLPIKFEKWKKTS